MVGETEGNVSNLGYVRAQRGEACLLPVPCFVKFKMESHKRWRAIFGENFGWFVSSHAFLDTCCRIFYTRNGVNDGLKDLLAAGNRLRGVVCSHRSACGNCRATSGQLRRTPRPGTKSCTLEKYNLTVGSV